MNDSYNFKEIENKWNKYWDDNKLFYTDVHDFSKPKYYVLDMFPYPSGLALHVGHPLGYIATDIVARFKRMEGYNVLHPMGFDAFGLPSEQYAIKTGNNPASFTKHNIEVFKKQLKEIGLSYDWSKEISTADPSYYKWTQYIFTLLYKKGLAYKKKMYVNWCEGLGTVLANDEVIDGKSERGGYPVVRKQMDQWVIDIPSYAEKLLEGLNGIDWPESTKEIQRNWIGKSTGMEIDFKVKDTDKKFTVFTTRADTLFGATYIVLAPDHELVSEITTSDNKDKVNEYIKKTKNKSEIERLDNTKEKTGVFLGSYAINPVNNKEIPIYISDYVLMGYGTGAIMAVPAHDTRDYEFAKKYNLEIIKVLDTKDDITADAPHINSDFLDGLNKNDAIEKISEYLEKEKIGRRKTNYKMREWIFSRQRYWGEPLPVYYDKEGNIYTLSKEELPLVLPELEDYRPLTDGSPALNKAGDWVNFDGYKRETSTMPGSAGSSWYFLRYVDPDNKEELGSKELLDHWLPVDLYVGGPEHATGHLLYARMWNRFLAEEGYLKHKEPFKKLFHQGMVLGENGIKMGKRYPKYAINPSEVIKEYGADALRVYQMFMGPLEASKTWNTNGLMGAKKFLDRVWRLALSDKVKEEDNSNLDKVYNETIKKVKEDYENLSFNTAISQMMIFINECYKENVVPKKYLYSFLVILNPIAPFITEELASKLFNTKTLVYEKFPEYDQSKLKEDSITIGVQVNGKLRGTVLIKEDEEKESVIKRVKEDPKIAKYISGKEIVKEIYIKAKIVNIVIK